MALELPIVQKKHEGLHVGGSGIFVRIVATVKTPSEIYEELISTNAYYSLADEETIEFKIGKAHYSSRMSGKKICLNLEVEGLHEKAYMCRNIDDVGYESSFLFLGSWIKDIRKETYAVIYGKKYESNEDEYKEFLEEIQGIAEKDV